MHLNRMAVRNLLRNKRRTLITAFSVAFGLLLSVTFTASGDYSYTNMINTSVTMGLGHLTIEPPGYNDTPTLDKRLVDADGMKQKTLATGDVEAAFVRIMGQAMFAAGAKNVGGMFIGIDPAAETARYNIFIRNLQEGKIFTENDGRGIVIGARMAEKLNVGLGKKVVYTVTDKNGELTSEVSRVSGIFKTGDDAVDGSVALLPIDRVRRTLRYEPQAASFVAIFLNDHRKVAGVRKELAEIFTRDSAAVLTWNETQADLAGIIAIDRFFNYLLQFLIGLLIAAGITNTQLMSVLERTREFGVMIAIGMSPLQLVRMILIESFWIGVFGLLLGIAITIPWYAYMSEVGIDLGRHIGEDYSAGGVLVDPVLKFRLFKENALIILAGVFGLTLLAGLYPAFRAGRVPPVESLKNI